ncbi:hypothetical protein AG1IA_00791 [Rhizoctonia solani AG-1 IA]|uniref:Glucose receptor Git3 N-terminal domain-containing protein n=1 Tax=Thanatephorus cucumeris (strain AG1-IA) TaxID=983506 RepID=L8X4F1_THACA|nr:hypothetical protein AG1IA_00791 [Rhizoctonia solani AG-1 IA]
MDNTGTGCRRIALLPGHAIGLAFSTQTGSISFAGVLVLFGLIILKYRRGRKRNTNQRRMLFRSNLDVYMINLFISELLMSLGGMLDAKWANESAVYCGGYCDAQGSLQYLGETSVALWTLAVTLHTWQSVVCARRIPFRWLLCVAVTGVIWGFVFLFNFVAFSQRPRSGDDSTERLVGNIVLGSEGIKSHRWHWTPPSVSNVFKTDTRSEVESPAPDDIYDEVNIRKEATKMLWYPAAYTILVLPLSIVRWANLRAVELKWDGVSPQDNTFRNGELVYHKSMAIATLVFHALFRLSGVINVILVLATRPNVLLFGDYHGEEGDDYAENHSNLSGMHGIARVESDDTSMRQRYNNISGERGHGCTGFGGQLVTLNRHSDDAMLESR